MRSTPSFRPLILIILTCCSLYDSQAQQGPDSVGFRKETITRLLAMHDYVPNFFFLDQQGTVAYLHLTPETDNYTDSIIGLMIEYESALDGKAYLFMSAAGNQRLATARTHIPDLGYRMYAACIGLVSQKSNYAIQTRNKALLRRCEQENLRVYQDKAQAKKINAKMEQYFGKNE